jgi:hypothetical protein
MARMDADTTSEITAQSLRSRWGSDWVITQDPESGICTATLRPTPTALRFLVGHTPRELHERLRKATS